MKLSTKLVEELNIRYGWSDLISFSVEKGATLFYRGLLKSFIEKHSISDSEGFQKAFPCFLEEMREAYDVIVGWKENKTDKIWWEYDNHGVFLKTFHAYEPLYVFYFGDNFLDPVSILREEGKVSFEIFIDNIAAWERDLEAELEKMEDSGKLNETILKELNSSYSKDFLSFSEKGLTLHYKGSLKEFIEENNIVSEMDFDKKFGDFRDEVLIKNGLDPISFCMVFPYGFGMTNAPVFGIEGVLGVEDMPVKYAFLFFNRYQVVDWLRELIESGEVTFETFVDNTKAYEASLTEDTE